MTTCGGELWKKTRALRLGAPLLLFDVVRTIEIGFDMALSEAGVSGEDILSLTGAG